MEKKISSDEAVIRFPLNRKCILVVDDLESDREIFKAHLSDEYKVYEAEDSEEALRILTSVDIGVVLLDIKLGKEDGLNLLTKIKNNFFNTEVIMVSVVDDVPFVVDAMKKGALDYVVKWCSPQELKSKVAQAFERIEMKKYIEVLKDAVEERESIERIVIGKNKKIQKIFELAEKVAKLPTNVLITGESGTGKEVLARFIHHHSQFSRNPFVVVNLNNLPAELADSILFGHEKGAFTGALKRNYGKFELADGGTIFLDDVGDMPLHLQGKLLRVLQTGTFERVGGERSVHVHVRVIAATNKDLKKLVAEKKFRDDLFYRLNVIPFHLPPLRERQEDIPEFVDYFIKKFSIKFKKVIRGIEEEALKCLMEYPWPGNIRELENFMERLVALNDSGIISASEIPMDYFVGASIHQHSITGKGKKSLTDLVQEFERNILLYAMKKSNYNKSVAAEMLNISRSTLRYKLKIYGFEDDESLSKKIED